MRLAWTLTVAAETLVVAYAPTVAADEPHDAPELPDLPAVTQCIQGVYLEGHILGRGCVTVQPDA